MSAPREVVVTGIGVVLPGCMRRNDLWRQLRDGESQLRFEPNPAAPDRLCAMGRIHDFDPADHLGEFPPRFWSVYPRELQIYLASLLHARDDAAIDLSTVEKERVGLFDGCARTTFEFWYERIRAEGGGASVEAMYNRRDLSIGLPGQTVGVAASLLQVRGAAYTYAGTCSSGAIAIGHAYREIRDGELDVAFAGGHETSLLPPLYAMYADAHLLSDETRDPRRAIRPFVEHSTNAFGEGAITLVLESREHAERRGATPLTTVLGYRYGNNGYHPTTVDIKGVRPSEVIGALIRTANIATNDIDFVVGHGNGVEISDVSEERYMQHVFGARAAEVPLISTKPIYGHTLGASSALNVAAAALMLHEGFIIPTINIDESRRRAGTNHQANHGAARDCRHGLTLSYGMGGHNAAILLGRAR